MAPDAALLGEVVAHALGVWEGAWLFIPLWKSGEVATGLLKVLAAFPGGGIRLAVALVVTGCESSKHTWENAEWQDPEGLDWKSVSGQGLNPLCPRGRGYRVGQEG